MYSSSFLSLPKSKINTQHLFRKINKSDSSRRKADKGHFQFHIQTYLWHIKLVNCLQHMT
uniref:Uncharacterized protein n=1 Tax=Anguilla anguilla TaxID=7936 RepID=A0A0E9XJU6_ANGAN